MKSTGATSLFQPSSLSSDLWGHASVMQHIADCIKKNIIPSTLLLHGPQGIGKTTLAYHIARLLLNTDSYWPLPPEHPLWYRVSEETHPDFFLLTAASSLHDPLSHAQSIPVENVRHALHFLQRHKTEGSARVMLIDPVDQLNRSGINALLKTLEEPHPKTFILMISHHPHQLIPTLRSRCCSIRCQPLNPKDFQAALQTTPVSSHDFELYQSYCGGRLGWVDALYRYGGTVWHDTWSDPQSLPQHMLTWIEDARKDQNFFDFLTLWMTWWIRRHLHQSLTSTFLYQNIQCERDVMAALAMKRALNLDTRQVLLYVFNRIRTLK